MLNPAIVQAMTAEALCESLVRTQQLAEQHRGRADMAETECEKLRGEVAALREQLDLTHS